MKMKQLLLEKEKAMKVQIEKDLSKNVVVTAGKDDKGLTNDDRAEVTEFFKALAAGPQAHARANDIMVKQYETKGLEWREDGEIKTKAQTVSTSSQGGLLVPTTWSKDLIDKMYYISPMRQIATVINDMPANLLMSTENALPTTYWVGEGTAITESGSTFAQKSLVPYKLAGFDSFTSESLADIAINPSLQGVIQDKFATSMALAENAAFVNGAGSTTPYGFRSSDITPTTVATNTTAGNLAYADILALYFALPTAYRNQAVWVTSSTGVQLLDSIKDSNGRPIYLPGYTGFQSADPVASTLLGRPLYVVDEIPNNLGAGTNETQLWFGVFKNYWIGNRGALRMDYGTNGTDFAQDKISLRMIERVAGRPYLDVSWAVKNIK